MKVNTTSVFAARVCPDATVRVNLSVASSKTPVNFAASAPASVRVAAAAFVSAVIVTTEEAAAVIATFGLSVTVNVLVALARGVLWAIIIVVNALNVTILRGFAPPPTPSTFVSGTVIAVAEIVAEPVAAMLGVTAL